MNEGNIPSTDRKNSYYFIYFLNILNTYQRETKLFKFSQYTNGDELKKKEKEKKTTSLCNSFNLR